MFFEPAGFESSTTDQLSTRKNRKSRRKIKVKKQTCNPEAGIIYIDILSNLERIGDHVYDISLMVISELSNSRE